MYIRFMHDVQKKLENNIIFDLLYDKSILI
jgi:hypothetical protein